MSFEAFEDGLKVWYTPGCLELADYASFKVGSMAMRMYPNAVCDSPVRVH